MNIKKIALAAVTLVGLTLGLAVQAKTLAERYPVSKNQGGILVAAYMHEKVDNLLTKYSLPILGGAFVGLAVNKPVFAGFAVAGLGWGLLSSFVLEDMAYPRG